MSEGANREDYFDAGFKLRHLSEKPRDIITYNQDTDVADIEGIAKLQVTKVVIDSFRGVLICGTRHGFIFLFSWPLKSTTQFSNRIEANCYAKYAIHDSAIKTLSLMPRSGVLVSAGEDGNLFVMDLTMTGESAKLTMEGDSKMISRGMEGGGRSSPGDAISGSDTSLWGENPYEGDDDIVLVKKSEYQAKVMEAQAHMMDIKQLQNASEYKFRATQEHFQREMKSLKSDTSIKMEAKDKEIESLKKTIEEMTRIHLEETRRIAKEAEEKLENERDEFENRLYEQFTKFDKVADENSTKESKAHQEKRLLEDKIVALENEMNRKLEELNRTWTGRYEQLDAEMKLQVAAYEETISQMEDEHSSQVDGLRNVNQMMMAKNRETTAVANADISGFKRKLDHSALEMKEITSAMEEARERESEKDKRINILRSEVTQVLLRFT